MYKFLIIPLAAWVISFAIKRLVDAIKHQKRYLHYGGWPSSHSAIMSGLTSALAFEFGISSAEFAIAFIFTAIVITDALALRPLIGRHSKIMNDAHQQQFPEQTGHKPNEVVAGIVLGILVAWIFFILI